MYAKENRSFIVLLSACPVFSMLTPFSEAQIEYSGVKPLLTRDVNHAFRQHWEGENAIQNNMRCRYVALQTARL